MFYKNLRNSMCANICWVITKSVEVLFVFFVVWLKPSPCLFLFHNLTSQKRPSIYNFMLSLISCLLLSICSIALYSREHAWNDLNVLEFIYAAFNGLVYGLFMRMSHMDLRRMNIPLFGMQSCEEI